MVPGRTTHSVGGVPGHGAQPDGVPGRSVGDAAAPEGDAPPTTKRTKREKGEKEENEKEKDKEKGGETSAERGDREPERRRDDEGTDAASPQPRTPQDRWD